MDFGFELGEEVASSTAAVDFGRHWGQRPWTRRWSALNRAGSAIRLELLEYASGERVAPAPAGIYMSTDVQV